MRYTAPVPKPAPRAVKARKPLTRGKTMRRKRARRIDRETPAERYYKQWVHERNCVGALLHQCDGTRIQQAHYRDRTGISLKESNLRSLPMCKRLHDAYDGRARDVCFLNWTLELKKLWFLGKLTIVHADFEREHGRPPEAWG